MGSTPQTSVSLVERIRAGDAVAESELVQRFTRGVRAILRCAGREPALVDDLHQETMRILLESIRAGAVRDPAQLAGFVASLARNLATEHFRHLRRTEPRGEAVLQLLEDPAPSAYEVAVHTEQAALVRRILDELPIERDRDVLRRFYLGQDSKDRICADYGLSSLQFNRVLHRARDRFRELWAQSAASRDE
jgi:RNA polymerase sigma-70 factor (ECF subfamily)